MIKEILKSETLVWIDALDPTTEEINRLAAEQELPYHMVQDCLDPEHLPKVEDTGDALFIILRAYDNHCLNGAATVQELTRKLAIFLRGKTLITIHRAELPFLAPHLDPSKYNKYTNPQKLLVALAKGSALSYDKGLEEAELILESIDQELQTRKTTENSIIRLHETKRRLSTMKRLLWHLASVIQRLPFTEKNLKGPLQDLRETAEGQLFFADQLLEEANSLLNLEFSLTTQKNNETIRVLTLFSAFFMPLTFIVGIYGMNFKFMPELDHPNGYIAIWAVMIAVVAAIWSWFKIKRWL
jgi:magnesium transporter